MDNKTKTILNNLIEKYKTIDDGQTVYFSRELTVKINKLLDHGILKMEDVIDFALETNYLHLICDIECYVKNAHSKRLIDANYYVNYFTTTPCPTNYKNILQESSTIYFDVLVEDIINLEDEMDITKVDTSSIIKQLLSEKEIFKGYSFEDQDREDGRKLILKCDNNQ